MKGTDMEKGKTVVFNGIKDIEIRNLQKPAIIDGNVIVKVDACALCTWEQRVFTGVNKVDYPFIGGHEMCGKIIEIGNNVDKNNWKIGDDVIIGVMLPCGDCYQCRSGNEQNCEHYNHSKQLDGLPEKGMGGLSSYLLMKPKNLFKYLNISPQEASLCEPLSCVIHSVETAEVQMSDFILVIGCGIMGQLHAQLAKKRGAYVMVSDMNKERTDLAIKLGADVAINPAKEDLKEKVLEFTGGIGAQVIFDTTPISKVVEDAIECLSINGKIVIYSSFHPDIPFSISPNTVHKKAIKILGTANSNTVDFTKAAKMLTYGIIDVKPFVSEVYKVEDVVEAFESAVKGDKYRVVVNF
jgi:2-desacetyl-2-hydroxyethyl bacteriochlorophyllide A dehydrogenase